jgi:hypothetical protein
MSFEGKVENGVIVPDASHPLADGTRVEITVLDPAPITAKSRTSLAEWADVNAEHWGSQLNSANVEGFTGRSF